MSKRYSSTLFIVMITFVCSASSVGMETDQLLASIKDKIPPREHGEGHYDQLIIRGAYMIDGSGGQLLDLWMWLSSKIVSLK